MIADTVPMVRMLSGAAQLGGRFVTVSHRRTSSSLRCGIPLVTRAGKVC